MKKNLSGVQGNYTQKYKYAYKISVLLEQYSKITENSIRFIVTGNYERNYYKLIKIYWKIKAYFAKKTIKNIAFVL